MKILTASLTFCFLMLSGGCATIIDTFSSEPIQADPTERSMGTWMNDEKIETIIAVNIRKADPLFRQSRVKVVSFNRNVLLIGQVPSEHLLQLARTTAEQVGKVRTVYNQLTVGPITSLATQSKDSWITTKIKAGLTSNKQVSSDKISVTTENGTVYLMGLVRPEQANETVQVAKETSGVKKVIKVFENI
ncbi:hypothetical protein CI610_01724 [invertebrate metagenome]|uniref:BON domain-containing protein n=1 Tax=invertebrate metagenome TaxID=1711999 RepID=A0A2H9T7U7_9ZZZZ